MKICHIIPRLVQGGAEVLLLRYINSHLTRHHHAVITLFDDNDSRVWNASDDRVTVCPYDRPSQLLVNLAKIRTTVRGSEADVVLNWMYHATALSPLLCPTDVPQVGYIHNTTLRKSAKIFERLAKRAILWHRRGALSGMIYCSQSAREHHESIGYTHRSVITILNGIDTDRFTVDIDVRKKMRGELGVSDDQFVFFYCGRMAPQKNLPATMMAVRAALDAGIDAVFVAAGAGITLENTEWVELLKVHRLQSNTISLGVRQDIPALLNASDALLLTSSYGEALSISMLEAIATGLPVVATDVGDAKYVLEGLVPVAPVDDSIAVSRIAIDIASMSLEERHALSKRLRERAIAKYSFSSMVEQLDRYLEQVVFQSRRTTD